MSQAARKRCQIPSCWALGAGPIWISLSTEGDQALAVVILDSLYGRDQRPAREVITNLAPRLGISVDRLADDALALIKAVGALLNEDYSANPNLVFGHFDRSIVKYPTLAEIALTYGCQNRCSFCYASSPDRKDEGRVMTTDEVKKVMGKIYHEAHVPSLRITALWPGLPFHWLSACVGVMVPKLIAEFS